MRSVSWRAKVVWVCVCACFPSLFHFMCDKTLRLLLHNTNTYLELLFISTVIHIYIYISQNFRTSSKQPDCKQYRTGDIEHTPALEAYVAVLSSGPVGSSDQIDTANVTLIMATWYNIIVNQG